MKRNEANGTNALVRTNHIKFLESFSGLPEDAVTNGDSTGASRDGASGV